MAKKSGLDKLMKIKLHSNKDVKNEDCSGWIDENKGAKKVLRMSYWKQTSYRIFTMSY
jgi:hypothetical protein